MTTRTGIWRGSIQCVDHGVQVSSVFLKRASRGDAEAERRCVQVAYRWECWADRQRLHSGMMLWSGLIVFQGASDFLRAPSAGSAAQQQRSNGQLRSADHRWFQSACAQQVALGGAWWSELPILRGLCPAACAWQVQAAGGAEWWCSPRHTDSVLIDCHRSRCAYFALPCAASSIKLTLLQLELEPPVDQLCVMSMAHEHGTIIWW